MVSYRKNGQPFVLLMSFILVRKSVEGNPTQPDDSELLRTCDELKCRSPDGYGGYDCWALGDVYEPFSCEGDYVGVPLPALDPVFVPEYGISFYYYTCCPPELTSAVDETTMPECSLDSTPCSDARNDCWVEDDETDPMSCDDELFMYPKKTGGELYDSGRSYHQYRCCDTPTESENMASVESNPVEEEVEVVEQSDSSMCDELKCRSWDGYVGYDCWALGNETEPFSCEGDYVGVPLPAVAPFFYPEYGLLYYYTCCPPDLTSAVDETTLPECAMDYAPCSDIFNDCWADGPFERMSCDDELFKYPKKTGASKNYNGWNYHQYRCCSTPTASEHRVVQMETLRIVFCGICLVLALSFLVSMLMYKTVRDQAFNMYLILLEVPIIIYCLSQIFVGAAMITDDASINPVGLCSVYVSAAIFEGVTMTWLYALVLAQVYVLLKKSKRRERANPPSGKRVLVQASATFLCGIVFGVWGMFVKCIGSDKLGFAELGDEPIQQIVFISTYVFSILIPFVCISYIMIQVWKRNLLPRSGKTKTLYLYMMRILVLFFMYLIFGILVAVAGIKGVSGLHGLAYVGPYSSLLFAIVNLAFMLRKPDLRDAYRGFWSCKWSERAAGMAKHRTSRQPASEGSPLSGSEDSSPLTGLLTSVKSLLNLKRLDSNESLKGKSDSNLATDRIRDLEVSSDAFVKDDSPSSKPSQERLASETEIEFHRVEAEEKRGVENANIEGEPDNNTTGQAPLFSPPMPDSIWYAEDDWSAPSVSVGQSSTEPRESSASLEEEEAD